MIGTFTLARELMKTHKEWPRRVCVIAARYYNGVESVTDMLDRINPPNIGDMRTGPRFSAPTLTSDEFDSIKRWR